MDVEEMFDTIEEMADNDTAKGVVIGAAVTIIGVVTGAEIADDD